MIMCWMASDPPSSCCTAGRPSGTSGTPAPPPCAAPRRFRCIADHRYRPVAWGRRSGARAKRYRSCLAGRTSSAGGVHAGWDDNFLARRQCLTHVHTRLHQRLELHIRDAVLPAADIALALLQDQRGQRWVLQAGGAIALLGLDAFGRLPDGRGLQHSHSWPSQRNGTLSPSFNPSTICRSSVTGSPNNCFSSKRMSFITDL
mmetsp:Transcript_7385/g.18561  ORF Transcript_7385/g.18561 Transcript_7385/m.18561 type:complete len:202 (-) Transcript_7385:1159-1764(-)